MFYSEEALSLSLSLSLRSFDSLFFLTSPILSKPASDGPVRQRAHSVDHLLGVDKRHALRRVPDEPQRPSLGESAD